MRDLVDDPGGDRAGFVDAISERWMGYQLDVFIIGCVALPIVKATGAIKRRVLEPPEKAAVTRFASSISSAGCPTTTFSG